MATNPLPAARALTEIVFSASLPEETIRQRLGQIQRDALTHSSYLREEDFKAIHPRDLEFLFDAYDAQFFGGHCRRALEGRTLRFRLSPRMTSTGGTTMRRTTRTGEVSYEISIACSMLFDGFDRGDRGVTVCGLSCQTRLQALHRIFEHEMVHLIEHLCWGNSDCKAARFQGIATRCFLHQAHTHNLVTRFERAAQAGIRIGSRVTFVFEGRELTGRVNRVTKRVTVLVEDAEGRKYSDGLRYRTYYVPIAHLTPAPDPSAR